jgi:integrase
MNTTTRAGIITTTLQKGRRPQRMMTAAWKKARERAANKWEQATGQPCPEGFRNVRVHDLKYTFGRRLRAAGVSFEDRQDLLGHKSSRITTHYSAAELASLIAAAEKACETKSPTKVLTTRGSRASSAQESISKCLNVRELI